MTTMEALAERVGSVQRELEDHKRRDDKIHSDVDMKLDRINRTLWWMMGMIAAATSFLGYIISINN